MNIAEMPIAAIRAHSDRRRRPSGRAQLPQRRPARHPHAPRGAAGLCGQGHHAGDHAEGRWLVPPDRAVWVPARLEHSIDVLADIQMRTLYFDLAWLAREHRSAQSRCRIRGAGVAAAARIHPRAVRGRDDPDRTDLLIRLAMLELHQAEDATTFIPLPHEPRCRRAAKSCWPIQRGLPDRRSRPRGRHLGTYAVAAVLMGNAIEL